MISVILTKQGSFFLPCLLIFCSQKDYPSFMISPEIGCAIPE